MSITNTVLVFVVTPAVIVLIIAGLSLRGGAGRRAPRYRPGRPYEFAPTWFVSTPGPADRGAASGDGRAKAPAIESGEIATGGRVPMGSTGGASDRW